MSTAKEKTDARAIETQIEIAAPVEAVWKALADAEELVRWFPLQARVTPGAGGSIWGSWGPPWEMEARIEIWEPNRRLRVAPPWPAAGADGLTATDYILEARGGTTVLRLVHSGFQIKSDWDEEYVDATRRGWQFELRGLRHYLEHHRGTPRAVAWARATFEISPDEAWNRLMGPAGLLREGSLADPKEWDRYSIRAATGDSFEGIVHLFQPPWDFCATVENLNNAFLRVRLDQLFGRREANIWLSAYDLPQPQVDSLRDRWTALLQKLYPAAVA